MSLKVMSMCLAAKLGTPTRLAVAIALADHADDDGASIYPSIARIAEKADVSRRTAQYTLRKLEEDGLLVVISEGGQRGKDTREWRFDLDKLAALVPVRGAISAPVEGRKPRHAGVQSTTRRGAAVAPKPSLTVIETSNASELRASADATPDEIGGLNGATHAIVQGVASWLSGVGCKPDVATARKIISSNVGLYGADAVRRGFADMQADVIGGKLVGNPLKAFTGYCDTAKSGRAHAQPKARDWHAEKKASRERLFAEVEEIKRKRAAAMEAAR